MRGEGVEEDAGEVDVRSERIDLRRWRRRVPSGGRKRGKRRRRSTGLAEGEMVSWLFCQLIPEFEGSSMYREMEILTILSSVETDRQMVNPTGSKENDPEVSSSFHTYLPSSLFPFYELTHTDLSPPLSPSWPPSPCAPVSFADWPIWEEFPILCERV